VAGKIGKEERYRRRRKKEFSAPDKFAGREEGKGGNKEKQDSLGLIEEAAQERRI